MKPQPPVARFFAHTRIETLTDCWIWQGGRTGRNLKYGRMRLDTNPKGGVRVCAHRFAYEFFVGPIPDGYEIDHECENTLCVNPAHLKPRLPEENKALRYGRRYVPNQIERVDADADALAAMFDREVA